MVVDIRCLLPGVASPFQGGRDRATRERAFVNALDRRFIMPKSEEQNLEPLNLEIEVLEERIAPSATGSGGFEGQPGGQGGGGGSTGGGGNTGFEGQPGGQSNG
jgi:uncharacterized membrane protein YgcG